MTYTQTDVDKSVEQGKAEIVEFFVSLDPHEAATIKSFSDLHDYTDANVFGGLCDGLPYGGEELMNFGNEVQNALDAWIKNGGLPKRSITVTVKLEVPDVDLYDGWDGSPREYVESLIARLDAVIGDDGGEYRPTIVGIVTGGLRCFMCSAPLDDADEDEVLGHYIDDHVPDPPNMEPDAWTCSAACAEAYETAQV